MPFTYFNNFIERRYPELDEEEQRNVFVFYVLTTILLLAILPWIFIFHEYNAPLMVYMHIGLVGSMALLLICSAFLNLNFKWSRFFLDHQCSIASNGDDFNFFQKRAKCFYSISASSDCSFCIYVVSIILSRTIGGYLERNHYWF